MQTFRQNSETDQQRAVSIAAAICPAHRHSAPCPMCDIEARRAADMAKADPLTDLMIDKLVEDYPLTGGERVALLVNDMGASTLMELYVVTRRAHQRLAEKGVTVADTWIGPYCTTQEMAGFSLTLLKLDAEMEELLARPASNESFLRP